MIRPDLLEILRCPETQQKLRLAEPSLIVSLNERIARGEIFNGGGHRVAQPLEAGLVREDEAVLYPIRNKLPIMLVDEAIPLQKG